MIRGAILFSGIKLVEESHPEYSANIGISISIIGIIIITYGLLSTIILAYKSSRK